MLKGGPQHWNLGASAAVQRAYSGFLKFRKLPERVKNAASFGHSNAESFSALETHYSLALRARHVSPEYGALAGFSLRKTISPYTLDQ